MRSPSFMDDCSLSWRSFKAMIKCMIRCRSPLLQNCFCSYYRFTTTWRCGSITGGMAMLSRLQRQPTKPMYMYSVQKRSWTIYILSLFIYICRKPLSLVERCRYHVGVESEGKLCSPLQYLNCGIVIIMNHKFLPIPFLAPYFVGHQKELNYFWLIVL